MPPPFSRPRTPPLTDFTAVRAAALDGPAWLRARRSEAAARFEAGSLPTTEDELWRYTPIADLDLDKYTLASRPTGGPIAVSPFAEAVTDSAGLIVIVDGYLVSAELDAATSAAGVTVSVATDDVGLLDPPDPDALTDLHAAFAPEVVVVRVPDGVVLERPLVVVQSLSAEGGASFAHLVIITGTGSEVTIVDHSTSGDIAAYANPIVELQSGANAHVRYVGVQDLGPSVWCTAHLIARPGRDGTVRAWLAALGGAYARLYVSTLLDGQGGSADIAGVYFGEDDQVHDFRSLQDHAASRTASNFLLKGAVEGDAHAIYTGLIKVRQGAKATDSFLANRNLVLADGAHVDSVPNLEIVNENDIRTCGHAAATGPVDEEHVFYLESRGVPTEAAERLIVFGFFEDVVASVPVAGVRQPLREAVTRKLAKAPSHV